MEAIVNSAEIASAVTLKNVLGHQAATPFYIWANEDCDNRTDSFDEAKEIRLSFFNLGMANVHICDSNGVEVVDREIEAHEALVSAGYFAGERRPDVKPTFPGCFMVNDPEDPQGFAIVGDGIGALILEAYDQLIEPEDASPQVQDPVSSGADCTVLQAFTQVLRDRGELAPEAIDKLHDECDVDQLWSEIGPIIDRFGAGAYSTN